MNYLKKYGFYLWAIFGAVICFMTVYGVKILNPLYDDWLLRGGDLTQHYIGWEFFRMSEWKFPIGLMDTIAYPNDVSVIFTDSIPVFAVLFKLLSPFLPDTFQYFGLWGFLCFILQSVFSTKLLYYFTRNKIVACIGSLFFVMAPIFIARMFFHTALSSQWLLLLAWCLSLKYIDDETDIIRSCAAWGGMGILCAMIHIYYVPMCGIIMAGFLLGRFLRDKRNISLFLIVPSYLFGSLCMIYWLGGFSHDHQLDAGGLGQFSFNMNGFFNSMGWSRFFPPLSSYGEGSGDGFAYLGGGIFILLAISILYSFSNIFRRKERKISSHFFAYIFICVACVMISASHLFAINGNLVFELPYPNKLVSWWGMFRASGRFIWGVVYLLMFYAIATATKVLGKGWVSVPILFILFMLQNYDISNVLDSKRLEFKSDVKYESMLQDDLWETITNDRKHVIFVSHVTGNQDILYNVSQYAYLHKMTVNDFYLAHSAAAGDIHEDLETSMGNLQEDTIYIFKKEDEALCSQYPLMYHELDGIIVGLK